MIFVLKIHFSGVKMAAIFFHSDSCTQSAPQSQPSVAQAMFPDFFKLGITKPTKRRETNHVKHFRETSYLNSLVRFSIFPLLPY